MLLVTTEFHTKKGVIEAIYVDFWLVRGFNPSMFWPRDHLTKQNGLNLRRAGVSSH